MRTLVFAINNVLESIVVAHAMLCELSTRGDYGYVMAMILRVLIPACLFLIFGGLIACTFGW